MTITMVLLLMQCVLVIVIKIMTTMQMPTVFNYFYNSNSDATYNTNSTNNANIVCNNNATTVNFDCFWLLLLQY